MPYLKNNQIITACHGIAVVLQPSLHFLLYILGVNSKFGIWFPREELSLK